MQVNNKVLQHVLAESCVQPQCLSACIAGLDIEVQTNIPAVVGHVFQDWSPKPSSGDRRAFRLGLLGIPRQTFEELARVLPNTVLQDGTEDLGYHFTEDGMVLMQDLREYYGLTCWCPDSGDWNDPGLVDYWGQSVAEWARFQIISHVTAILETRGMFALHASAVHACGGIAAFLGPPGSGKSVTTLIATQHGYGFISDDRLIVKREKDGVMGVSAWHSLKIRRSATNVLGDINRALNDVGATGVHHYKTYDRITEGAESVTRAAMPGYTTDWMPMSALFFITGRNKGRYHIERCSPSQAFLELLQLSPGLVGTMVKSRRQTIMAEHMATMRDLSCQVPAFSIVLGDPRTLPECLREMVARLAKENI